MSRRSLIGLPWEQCRLVAVTASAPHGVMVPPLWPAPLDGILAGAARRRRLGSLYGRVVDHHIEDLPLATSFRSWGEFRRRGAGRGRARWVWLASSAVIGGPVEEVRWAHKRQLNVADAARVSGVDAIPRSNDAIGRYKPWRLPAVATLVQELRWVAVGDPSGIVDLLGDVTQIGDRRGSGEGVITDWHVEDMGPASLDPLLELGPAGRPWPAVLAPIFGFDADHVDTVPHTIRPPYWRPPQHEVDGGGFARQFPKVIRP